MLVLDDTIANIALPSIQRQFGVPDGVLPWVINAYVLAFGSLLLFGGRIGDLYGRRRILRIGLALFSAASLLGGLGVNVEMLIASRALQGLGRRLGRSQRARPHRHHVSDGQAPQRSHGGVRRHVRRRT